MEDAEQRVSLFDTRWHQPNNTHPLEDTSREFINQEVRKVGSFQDEDMVVTGNLRRHICWFLIRKSDSTT